MKSLDHIHKVDQAETPRAPQSTDIPRASLFEDGRGIESDDVDWPQCQNSARNAYRDCRKPTPAHLLTDHDSEGSESGRLVSLGSEELHYSSNITLLVFVCQFVLQLGVNIKQIASCL